MTLGSPSASRADPPAANRTVSRRGEELSRLTRLVTAVAGAGGRGGLGWVQGEPGIGKSALIDLALAHAATLGCTVLRAAATAPPASGEPVSSPLPLMAACLEGESPAGPAGRPGGRESARRAASLRTPELIQRLCAERPVVLAVEDLQWADKASLLSWNELARLTGRLPLLLIASTRATPRRETVERLRDYATQRGGTILDLGPLDSDGVAEVAARAAGGRPGPRLSALLARAGGHPGYLAGLLSAVSREGLLEVSEGLADLRRDMTAVPAAVACAIEVRLGHLPAGTQAALRVAAFLGPEFGAAEWAAATGRSVVAAADMIEAAAADGLLDGGGHRLRFRHELVRQVLISQVPPAGRPGQHADAARNLARAGLDAAVVARHLRLVRDPLPDWAVEWLAGLSEPKLALSLGNPADLLGRAQAAAGPGGRHWETLATRRARSLLRAGRDDEAMGVAEHVAGRTADPSAAIEMRIVIIRSASRTGQLARGRAVLAGVPQGEGRGRAAPVPSRWQARLAAWSAVLLRADGQEAAGATLARDALALATVSADPLAIACAQHAMASCADPRGRAAQIGDGLGALFGRDPESAEMRMLLLAAQAAAAAAQGDRGLLSSALREALALAAERPGSAGMAVLAAAADAGYRYGRWDEALSHARAVRPDDHAAARAPRPTASPGRGVAALIALRRGDRAAADAALADLPAPEPVLPGRPADLFPHPVYRVTEAVALRAEMGGDTTGAVRVLSAWLTVPSGLGDRERHDDVLPGLVRLAREAGQEEAVQAAVALSRADAAADPSAGRIAAARLCQALVGDSTAGLIDLAAEFEGHGWLPRQAFALEEAAVRLAAAGALVPAREALTGAVRAYAAMGAASDVRRADTRLRRHGVRRGSRSIRRGPGIGWEALTPAERTVADLAGHGLSNPDIAVRLQVSPRTVQNHLTRVLAKLGLRSRLEIIQAVAQRERAAAAGPAIGGLLPGQRSQPAVPEGERHSMSPVAELHSGQQPVDDVLDRTL